MEKIKEFLKVDKYPDGYGYSDGNGYGSGSGDGSGDGNGYGDGYGYGYGYGYSDGSGYSDGDGNGDGYGYGLKSLNNQKIHLIDSVQTIIKSVRGNLAKGFIVGRDLVLKACYIAKGENTFAHGSTAKEALISLQEKLLHNMPTGKRIEKFVEKFNSKVEKYKASEFYEWHFFLTGSCKLGRDSFVTDNGIDLNNDTFTVNEFIEKVASSYGSEIIGELKNKINKLGI